MLKIYGPLVLVLGLIIGALAYVKHFHTLGFNAGVAKTKLEYIIVITQPVKDMVDEMMKDDISEIKRKSDNDAIVLPVKPSCLIDAEWLRELSKLK